MDTETPSLTLTLPCTGCSQFQNDTVLDSQPDSNSVVHLRACAQCTVLQGCRTNRVPSKAEWSQIDALVKGARSDISRLQQETHQRKLTSAETQRWNELRRFILNARSLTAPIRKLPPEVLSEILQLICSAPGGSLWISNPEFYDIFDRASDNVSAQTLGLSQVSAFWRTIVLSQPSLWASLHIGLQGVWTPEIKHLVLRHIQSSQSRPLDLDIFLWVDPDRERYRPRSYAHTLFKRLLAETQRWRNVRLTTTVRDVPSLPSTSSFPILTSLDWSWDSEESDHSPQFDLLSLSNFPKLLRCNIESFSPVHLDSIRMPNLTELHLAFHFQCHPLAAFLHLFPNLRTCRIGALSRQELPRRPLVDLPPHCRLRYLSLGVSKDNGSLECFLHSLSLPNLESFSLSYHRRTWYGQGLPGALPPPITGLLPILESSQTNLKHLTLYSLPEQDIIQVLDRLPSLTTLSLEHFEDVSSAFFRRLTPSINTPDAFPQLRSLSIVNHMSIHDKRGAWFLRLEESTLDALCHMLESRRGSLDSVGTGVSRLESLSLSTGRSSPPMSLASLPTDHQFRKRLQPLIDTGLSLKLSASKSEH